ncbi:ABC transporter substrate-binding protein, partial [Burkholderia dolosa]|uniref:ABC transporter substrate-binding protein n=2 Tax=Burkholderia dolosa TaxID=152500 RepID=UPI0021BC11A0
MTTTDTATDTAAPLPASAAPDDARRRLLRAAGAAALAAPAIAIARHAWAAPPLKKLTFAWNQNAFCLTPIVVAQERGFFEKNGLKVELINYSGSTDQLLESIATGKADAAVGMIHRWLKPLEAGFDVKIIGSSHGGCVRLIGAKAAGVTTLQALKGKTVGVSDLAAPGKHFFSILLAKNGIDPERDVTWRQYPADLLGVAVDKGEIHAIADGDPNLYLLEKRSGGAYTELATNLSGEYARKVSRARRHVAAVSGGPARRRGRQGRDPRDRGRRPEPVSARKAQRRRIHRARDESVRRICAQGVPSATSRGG